MPITLYDATVAPFLQTLSATENVLLKGADWCQESGFDPNDAVAHRLREDMLPLQFQIISVAHHSLGAIQGVEGGTFTPPPTLDLDFAGLQELVTDARSKLAEYDREAINALGDRELTFKTQSFSLDFGGQDFLLSFSVPNFYFHVTTAYDILRNLGVPLGKRDYLGQLSTKA